MSLRRTFFYLCLILLVLCLAGAYGIAGQWIGAILATLMGPAWWLARKYAATPLPLVCLLASVGLAVAGSLIGSPPLPLIFASALALAVWDLLLLDSALGKNSSGEQTRQYETRHLRSLMLALGSGLGAVLLGHFLTMRTPFLVLLLSISFILFALDRVWGYLKKTR